MPGSEDGIYIDHGTATTFSEEMYEQTRRIKDIVSHLEMDINKIVQSWLGPDRDIYFEKVQPTWNAEVSSLSTILQSHAQTLTGVSDHYKQTVYRNAQGFEEIKF
ncbi:WXG100 family type VII secretion target [Streptomyces kunmingensis]|uniref:WXG100 family type VII secretion target n=1 Tax=Streptomyces kunmingensis TaxID=68225 RepID=A0ABU6CE75_9ACTN|nr:WXG100 family type VII secretion target [Streptomyces kunmingensis]MEB3962998.1 WXG100 family type VII secretion target [Streptomyces kunmingensis]